MSDSWRIVIVSTVPPVVEYLAPALQGLGHEPLAAISARPSPTRYRTPEQQTFLVGMVHAAPLELDVLYPRDRHAVAPLLAVYEPDLVLCWGYPWKLPAQALEVPRLGCVNLHPGKLPRHRGPIPLSWALREGDTEFGVTWHRMDAELDTGRILAQATIPILDEDSTIEDIGPRLGAAALSLLPDVLERVAAGDPGEEQDEAEATWAGRFEEDYSAVDFTRTAREVHDKVRAWTLTFGGMPGAIAELDGQQVRLLRTSLVEQPEAIRVECADAPIWIVAHEPVEVR